MKKILFFVCLFCVSLSYAQTPITLDINDLAAPPKHFDARNDTAVVGSITPGNPGANVTWNFSALHSTFDTLYIDVVNPAIIPMHTLFPTANVAIIYDSAINIYFFNRSASGLVMNGTINDFLKTGDSIRVALSIPDTALALPGIYGDSAYRYSYGDTKSHSNYMYDTNFGGFPVSVPIDTIQIKHRQYKFDKLDAWGTVTTPNSTFPALRQKYITYSHDSIWGYADCSAFPPPYNTYSGWYFLLSRKDTVLTYAWWTKNLGVPAIKMNMAGVSSAQIINVEWAYSVPSSIVENEILSSNVFPNPASDFINITNTSGYKEIVIYDIIGNEISRQNIENSDMVKVSVQNLANGLYFYNAINSNSKASGKFIVKH